MIRSLLLFLLFAATLIVSALLPAAGQDEAADADSTGPYWAMFWNVENLFDSVDDPESEVLDAMSEQDLTEKLRRQRAVIRRVNWGRGPDILGVAEVENAKLIRELVGEGYEVVFDRGEYARGLNTGLATRLPLDGEPEHLNPGITGRTILHATLKAAGERLHVYVLHFKSKYNRATETWGTREDELIRAKESAFLRDHLLGVLKKEPQANLLVMGDYNEHYRDSLFRTELLAREYKRGDNQPDLSDDDTRFLNLGAALLQSYPEGGTCYYHPHWNIFDNVLISEALADPAGLYITPFDAHIGVSWDLLNNYGQPAHFKRRYPTCASDHLPVLTRIRVGE